MAKKQTDTPEEIKRPSLSSSNTGSPDKETPGLVTGEIDREIGILTKD